MFFNWNHIWSTSQLIRYVHIYPVTDFRILIIPGVIFQARTVKFGSDGVLNTLINMIMGFVIIEKF